MSLPYPTVSLPGKTEADKAVVWFTSGLADRWIEQENLAWPRAIEILLRPYEFRMGSHSQASIITLKEQNARRTQTFELSVASRILLPIKCIDSEFGVCALLAVVLYVQRAGREFSSRH